MQVCNWSRRRRVATFWLAVLLAAAPMRAAEIPEPPAHDLEDEYGATPSGFPDPLESLNRGILSFNQEVDRWILDPVTRVYRFILPDKAKRAIQRFLNNLNSPGVIVNDLLQCEPEAAGITVWRFVVNSTFGIGGLFDPAQYLGVEGHASDFDQTLALYSIPSGPFLMLPVFGPTTARGAFGTIIDVTMRPTTYFLAGTDQFVFTIIHGGSSGLATREAAFDALKELEKSSIDYYAALRNAYYQKRMAEIWSRRDAPLIGSGRSAAGRR